MIILKSHRNRTIMKILVYKLVNKVFHKLSYIDNAMTEANIRRKEKLIKHLKETKEYDEKIAHLALSRIEIDLDDGVKVNYEKIQTGTEGKKYPVLGKI